MKKITFTLCALILLVACNSQQKTNPKETNETTSYLEESEKMVEFQINEKEMIDWKTYENTKFGFQFKYPSDWTLSDSPISTTPDPEGNKIAFHSPTKAYGTFHIEVLKNEPSLKGSSFYLNECQDLNTCVENNRSRELNGNETTGLSDISINGEGAKKEVISSIYGWKYYTHYIYKNKNLFIISWTTSIEDEEVVLPTLQGILSTIEFKEIQSGT